MPAFCRVCEGSGELVVSERHSEGEIYEEVIACFNCEGTGVGGQ